MNETNASFAPVRDLRVAVMFLTRIPTGWINDLKASDLGRAAWAFSLVGLIVGGIAGSVLYAAASTAMSPLACALIGLCVQAFICGALHEDGLADVADGFGACDKDRILEIMRDSRIGSYGVLALIFSVGVRTAALASLTGPGYAALTMVAAAMLSRGVLPLIMHAMPPARGDGLGFDAGQPTLMGAGIAVGIGLIALFAALPLAAACAGVLLGALLVAGLVFWAHRRLGGHTGDVLGATQQLIEIAVLLGAAGWSASY